MSGGAVGSGGRPASGGNGSGGQSASGAGGGLAGGGASATGGSTSGAGMTALGGAPPQVIPDDPCAERASYRDLFAEMLGKSSDEVQRKVDASFQHFFHGSSQQTLYYESASDEAYILDVNNGDVRSEGMSYGMMIAVQLNKQAEFDRLWKWAKAHTQQSNGYLAWQASPSGQVLSTASAPDGEEYFATALVFAAHRWPGGGQHDYAADAQRLLGALRRNGAFNENPPLVKFLTNVDYTDPSYVLPGFYQVWACFDQQNRSFWQSAITSGRTLLRNTAHQTTGLAPYLANFDGSPHSAGPNFNTDAWRVVGNIMADHHWFRADDSQLAFANRYASFFESAWAQNPNAYEFSLTGNVQQASSGGPPRGLIAMNSLVAFASSAELGKPALQALWDLRLPEGQYRYYDGMLYLFALLHASGNYRLY